MGSWLKAWGDRWMGLGDTRGSGSVIYILDSFPLPGINRIMGATMPVYGDGARIGDL